VWRSNHAGQLESKTMSFPFLPDNLRIDDEAHCRTISWAHEACVDHGVITGKRFRQLCVTILAMRQICSIHDPRVDAYISAMMESVDEAFKLDK